VVCYVSVLVYPLENVPADVLLTVVCGFEELSSIKILSFDAIDLLLVLKLSEIISVLLSMPLFSLNPTLNS
jgi:hypothetical protein